MEHGLRLEKPEGANCDVHIQDIVGTLMHTSIATRPDISFAVNYMSWYQGTPTHQLLKYAKRILAYFNLTKDFTLNFINKKNFSNPVINVYTDASYAADYNRVSTSGVLVQLWIE